VPLITHHPFFSIWCNADQLNSDWSRHWTGATQGISVLARIGEKTWRIMGTSPEGVAAEQLSLQVWPTRTIYTFRCGLVQIELTFCTPALCDDLDLLARPVTYLNIKASSSGAARQAVQICVDTTGQLAVDADGEPVDTARLSAGGLSILRASATDQRVLQTSGDNRRIEWGYFYLAADAGSCTSVLSDAATCRKMFARTGNIPRDDRPSVQKPVNQGWANLAIAFDLGIVDTTPIERNVMFAFDEVFCVEYLHQKLSPWWRRHGESIVDILSRAASSREKIVARCVEYDQTLVAHLAAAGGPKYAAICSLAYRQAIAAHCLAASADGEPYFFSKENFSNGCIATVDVTYPSAPLFLLLQPRLLEGMLTPILKYAALHRWKFPFAPHDLGQYPLANGQVYGGGEQTEENQMPVEECGNILILCAALAKRTGSAKYAKRYWKLLTRWAQYLKEKGLDPDEQLCTDDFAGHLGHNANLSIKAIIALASYGLLAEMLGENAVAGEYQALAREMAKQWESMARDGDHTRLAFDRPGTWSQKYNLVWDKLLGLNLFSSSIAQREVAFYKKKMTDLGLPLDNRATYTKNDWTIWCATLADSPADFAAFIDPLFHWLDTTPTRVPITDWYETTDGRQVQFQARSVVGGFFIKLLADTMKPSRQNGPLR
jgi:hypothetical protein